MFILNRLARRRAKKQQRQEEYLATERKMLEEEVDRLEEQVKQKPLKPFPSTYSLDTEEFHQRCRDDSEWCSLVDSLTHISNMPPEKREQMELKRRKLRAQITIRECDIWNDLCKSSFWSEHH